MQAKDRELAQAQLQIRQLRQQVENVILVLVLL